SRTRPDFIRPRCSERWARQPASAPRSGYRRASLSTRSAMPARWPAASSNISPKALGRNGCTPAGRRKPASVRPFLAAPAFPGRAGFSGPRTVFEGSHGFFYAFAHTTAGDFAAVTDGFGAHWVTETLAFKPYPCGTMTNPYIDCARRLARRVKADDIVEMVC